MRRWRWPSRQDWRDYGTLAFYLWTLPFLLVFGVIFDLVDWFRDTFGLRRR